MKKKNYEQKNICIPIKLFNKHIPSVTKKLDCDYLVFGHYDGISVEKNIFEENNPVSFMNIWEYSLNNVTLEDHERNFSHQILYALRYDENGWEKDFDFWFNSDMDIPFIFLSIIQTEYVEDISEFRKCIEKTIEQHFKTTFINQKIKVICYSSFENNGFILAIKCSSYKSGIEIVNSMHLKNAKIEYGNLTVKIKYTYTLNGITSDIFNYKKYLDIDEEINHVHLYTIERRPGSIDELYEKLESIFTEKRIKRHLIAGNDDECFVLNSIKWNEFLPLFSDLENGFLTGASSLFIDSTYSISTHFLCPTSNEHYFNYDDYKDNNIKSTYDNINLCDKIGRHLVKIKEISENADCIMQNRMAITSRRMTYYKSMSQILNSLKKFEISLFGNHFNDYTYFMLFQPLELLSLAIHFISLLENRGFNMEEYLPSKEIFRFLNGVTLIGQNSLHSDRQFTQTPDFNTTVYESPARLNAFYGAFIKKVQEMLNKNNDTEYGFLIVPGLNEYMLVKDIFDKLIDKKRLFILEIPERQIFDPKNLLPALLHEIAHKVGSSIREREERDVALRKLLINMVVYNIFKFIQTDYFKNKSNANKIINMIEGELDRLLKDIRNKSEEEYNKQSDMFNNIIKEEHEMKEYKFPKRNCYLSSYEKVDFFNATRKTLNNLIYNKQFMFCLWEIYYLNHKDILSYSYIDFNENINNIFLNYITIDDYRNLDIPNNYEQKYSLIGEIDDISFLFSELYADIISIISLNLTMDAYLESIINNDLQLDGNNICESIMIIRISLVIKFMCDSIFLSLYNIKYWNINELNLVKQSLISEDIQKIKYYVLKIIYSSDENKLDLYIDNVPNILFTSIAHDIILDYIKICISSYNKIVLNKNIECRNELIEMYENICDLPNKNIEKLIQKIDGYILKYKESIKNELIETHKN